MDLIGVYKICFWNVLNQLKENIRDIDFKVIFIVDNDKRLERNRKVGVNEYKNWFFLFVYYIFFYYVIFF